MILYDKASLKSLVDYLNRTLLYDNIKMKRTRLYELVAHSQGFKTKAALDSAMPIMLDASDAASDMLLDGINRYGIKPKNFTFSKNHLLTYASESVQPFPCIARPGYGLIILLEWDRGLITGSYSRHESNGKTFDEFYGFCKSLVLPPIVLESEYCRLCEILEPLVQVVSEGHIYNGEEKHADFSECALEAVNTIMSVMENYDFEHANRNFYYGDFGPHPEEIYDLDIECITPDSVKDEGLSEVYSSGYLMMNHMSSDIDLRRLVASILENGIVLINHDVLLEFFTEMRDACVDNYQELQDKSTQI